MKSRSVRLFWNLPLSCGFSPYHRELSRLCAFLMPASEKLISLGSWTLDFSISEIRNRNFYHFSYKNNLNNFFGTYVMPLKWVISSHTYKDNMMLWFFSFCVLLQICTYQLFLFQSSLGSEYCLLKSRIPIYKKMKSYWKTNISWYILVLIQANLSSCHGAMDTLFILTQYVLLPS